MNIFKELKPGDTFVLVGQHPSCPVIKKISENQVALLTCVRVLAPEIQRNEQNIVITSSKIILEWSSRTADTKVLAITGNTPVQRITMPVLDAGISNLVDQELAEP